MDKGFCINCMKPTMKPIRMGVPGNIWWMVECTECSMSGPIHAKGYGNSTPEEALKEWDAIVDKLNLHGTQPVIDDKLRIRIMTTLSGLFDLFVRTIEDEMWHPYNPKSNPEAEAAERLIYELRDMEARDE